MACPRTADAPQGRALALIPAVNDDGADLLAVASDFERSVTGWRLSEHLPPGIEPGDLEDVRQRNAWVVDADSGAAPPAVAIQATAGKREFLWIVECGYAPNADLTAEAAGPSTIAILALDADSPIATGDRLELRLADWSGDGRQEVLAGDWMGRVLLADRGAGLWEAVMTIDGGPAVVDLDRDGRLESVERLPDGTWRLRTWTGNEVEETLAQDLAPDIPMVSAEALPPLSSDLFARRDDGTEVVTWRWAAGGGALERVEGVDTPAADGWLPLTETPRREAGRSANGRRVAAYRRDDLTSEVLVAAAPSDVTPGATRAGAIHVIDPTGGALDSPLVATYEREHEDYGQEGFKGLALSSGGERMAWGDGAGLWMMDLPDGPVTLLTRWNSPFSGESDVIEGLHRPAGWSPDGRYLLVEIGYFEGGDYGLWDLQTGSFARIPGSFGYVDGFSDISFLPSGRLLHARSGGDFGGNASLSLLDPTDLETRSMIQQTWPRLHEMASATVLGYVERPDDSIAFGLRSNLPFDAASNGIFVLAPGGGEPERIAGLPSQPPNADDPFTGGGFRCQMRFAPDASSFVCGGRESGSGNQRVFVGRIDTGELWDATQVFGADGVGPVEIAFGEMAGSAD